MRVITADKLDAAGLDPHQRFFVELWYGMTHLYSLDSYRVRCLNAHGIVRELNEELHIGLVNDDELGALCGEALEILQDDPLINTHFTHFAPQMRVIQPLLRKPPKGAKDSRNESLLWRQLKFVTQDFLVALDGGYLAQLCDAIPQAVKPNNEDQVRLLVSALLSELVAQGWPLESLFSWHRHFLKPVDQRTHTFEQDLTFMLRQLKRGPQSFRVTLRLSGSKKFAASESFTAFA